jgi:hypothetical protein
MSYGAGNGLFGNFIPRGTGPLGSENLLAAVAVHGGLICLKRCKVKALLFVVETAVVTPTAPASVKFWKQTTVGNTSTQSSCGVLNIPNAAVGAVLRKAITPVTFEVGDELSYEHITQVAGASAAGIGYYAVEIDQVDETPANEANITAST